MVRAIAIAVLLMSSAVVSAEPPPDLRVEATLEGGFSPFALVRYTLRIQGGVGTIAVLKQSRAEKGTRQGLGVVPPEALGEAVKALRACGLQQLEAKRSKGPSAQRWRFDVTTEAGVRSFEVSDPLRESDARYAACLDVLRTLSERHAGALSFRDVFYPEDSMGYLQVDSIPRARVTIDGVDTGELSPVRDIPLKVGEHVVTFRDEGRKIHKTYKVRIMSGMTTNLDVDLR